MDTISVKGETYVKAGLIAKELGYTQDYVGQLCRNGQVLATLVGRSWYVSERSIRAHKKNRYRSNLSKSTDAVKKAIEKRSAAPNYLKPDYLKPFNSVIYEVDEVPLLPMVEKKPEITPADKEQKEESSSLESEYTPEIKRFAPQPQPLVEAPVSQVSARPVIKKPVVRIISAAANRPIAQPRVQMTTEQSVSVAKKAVSSKKKGSFKPLVGATLMGMVAVTVLLGLESRAYVSRATPPDVYYHFDLREGLIKAREVVAKLIHTS